MAIYPVGTQLKHIYSGEIITIGNAKADVDSSRWTVVNTAPQAKTAPAPAIPPAGQYFNKEQNQILPIPAGYVFDNSTQKLIPIPPKQNTTVNTSLGGQSYTGVSIVDYLNSTGKPSDYNSRSQLAKQYGISNYTGTADQNTKLLNTLRTSQPSNNQISNSEALDLARTMGATPEQLTTLQTLIPLIESGDLIPTPQGFVSKTNGQIYSMEDVATATTLPVAQSVYKSGNTVDLKVFEMTSFKDFMGEAGKFIDPYYTSKYEQTKNLVSTKLNQLSEDLSSKKSELQRQSEDTTRVGRDTLAERGLTFSGQRQVYDTRAVEDLNRATQFAETEAYRSGQNTLSTAEGQVGTANLQGINLPSYGSRSLSFASTPIRGDLPYQQYGATDTLARTLASDKNAERALAYSYNQSKNSV